MTIKELYDEVKYLVASGYGDYEVEISNPEESKAYYLEDGWNEHESLYHSCVTFFGKEQ